MGQENVEITGRGRTIDGHVRRLRNGYCTGQYKCPSWQQDFWAENLQMLDSELMPFIKTDFSIPLSEITREKTSGETDDDGGGSTFRPVCFKCRVFDGPPGSAYAEFGGTKVLARVSGPVDDPNGDPNTATLSLKMKGVSEEVRIGSQILSVIKTCVMA
ncbi:unnamed protein product, partial [Strongylus vulgaris]